MIGERIEDSIEKNLVELNKAIVGLKQVVEELSRVIAPPPQPAPFMPTPAPYWPNFPTPVYPRWRYGDTTPIDPNSSSINGYPNAICYNGDREVGCTSLHPFQLEIGETNGTQSN